MLTALHRNERDHARSHQSITSRVRDHAAAALALDALPARAAYLTGLGRFDGPITTWLARAPASCVMSSYIAGGPPLPDSKRAFSLGGTDMRDWGAFAGETGPPVSAPPMRADLSRLTLGGNVRRGDSLATVRAALGLHALTPTDMAPACPGLAVVEVCDWKIAGCAPTPRPGYEGRQNIFGVIIFRYGRVAGFLWQQTWVAG